MAESVAAGQPQVRRRHHDDTARQTNQRNPSLACQAFCEAAEDKGAAPPGCHDALCPRRNATISRHRCSRRTRWTKAPASNVQVDPNPARLCHALTLTKRTGRAVERFTGPSPDRRDAR
ncbi:hypothetical protein ACCO45_010774 [Purpureocillium lilacinum]|uniref:Uncharacterized protein n=1 Tax=Purpureocillium lilacinum TaxID=33203 RepID=A0ACC4DIF0_PURLI